MSHSQPPLARVLEVYFVTEPAMPWARLQAVLPAALRGGVSCVQLREKDLDTRNWIAKAHALQQVLRPWRVPLIVNDRVDVAMAAGAEGVHLGQTDMDPLDARRLLGPLALLGWSVETLAQVRAAAELPVDYLGISPVYDTPSKPDTAPAWGLTGLMRARACTTLPLVAIGGVNADNAAALRAAGADGLAVVRAIANAAHPEAAARSLRAPANLASRPH